MQIIFCGLGSSDNFMGLYFCGIPQDVIYVLQKLRNVIKGLSYWTCLFYNLQLEQPT